jgi:hypothetical protein
MNLNSDEKQGLLILCAVIVGAIELFLLWVFAGFICPDLKIWVGAIFTVIPPGLSVALIVLVLLFLGGITTVVGRILFRMARRKYRH